VPGRTGGGKETTSHQRRAWNDPADQRDDRVVGNIKEQERKGGRSERGLPYKRSPSNKKRHAEKAKCRKPGWDVELRERKKLKIAREPRQGGFLGGGVLRMIKSTSLEKVGGRGERSSRKVASERGEVITKINTCE